MIYPNNFEEKIGFTEIRTRLKSLCLSTMGKELVDSIAATDDTAVINESLSQIREFRRIMAESDEFPLQYFFDLRESVAQIRIEGTHLEESELFDLRRSLNTIYDIVRFLRRSDDSQGAHANTDTTPSSVMASSNKTMPCCETAPNGETTSCCETASTHAYPALVRLTENVMTFPDIIRRIDAILDKFGKIKDTASPTLADIRHELAKTEGSVSRTLFSILKSAQSDGLVEKDVTPTMRDGRLVIPVAPSLKRKIRGIVHDESASGKTVFVEPAEVVEANNRIRELESEERREIIRILTTFSDTLRPHVKEILFSYKFLAIIDLIRAKACFAEATASFEPKAEPYPHIDWITARHPLLALSLARQGKKVVPLDITLTSDKRILIISGPNAGGKSVCLKTVGLLQYMLQCGMSIPVGERSKTGVFKNIMIDIGDEQSIENDLSTYSSHLLNMKNMMRQADDRTLLLIDEFGTGTEPQIGGAIAEAVLTQFCEHKAFGIITTHYQNLKHFADTHDGVANGAMLYDRHEMKALFQLAIGQPGSSFAIEIARKTGIPEAVIRQASDIVGSEYIQSDKYLQDIVRDKRYWENKRQTIHQREKDMERTIARYEKEIAELEQSRKDILRKAKEQAEELLRESNKKIENAIREIRESQAEKEETKKIREELNSFKAEVSDIDTKATDDAFAKKIKQIQERKERHKKRQDEKAEREKQAAAKIREAAAKAAKMQGRRLEPGDSVRIKGLTTVGRIESVDGKNATVIFGDMRTKMPMARLEYADVDDKQQTSASPTFSISRETRETIDNRKLNFHQDLDVRGMRGDEALNAVTYFIDDAILVGMPRVRILHGKGNGILRQLIRQYLSTVPNVTAFRDEHVQFGGAGITVVDL